jgi:hypothetical protein
MAYTAQTYQQYLLARATQELAKLLDLQNKAQYDQ